MENNKIKKLKIQDSENNILGIGSHLTFFHYWKTKHYNRHYEIIKEDWSLVICGKAGTVLAGALNLRPYFYETFNTEEELLDYANGLVEKYLATFYEN